MKIEEKLQKMIRIKTISSNEDIEYPKFIECLKELFPNVFNKGIVEIIHGNLLIKINGKEHSNPNLFMNHQDVVEVGDGWICDPFEGKIIDGKLYGRGTLDDKGGLCLMLEAINQLLENNFTPQNDLYFLSTVNEECTGHGAIEVTNLLKSRNIHFNMVLDEGGLVTKDPVFNSDSQVALVGIGEKCCCDLKISYQGNGGHASTPSKDYGLIRISQFINYINKHNLFKMVITDELSATLKSFAEGHKGFLSFILRNNKLFKLPLTLLMPSISPTIGAMLGSTIAFTKIESSKAHNVISDYSYVIANIRCSLHEGKENTLAKVRKVAKRFGLNTELVDAGYESNVSPINTEVFKLLKQSIREAFNASTVPYICTGASDSRYLTQVCDNVYKFAALRVNEQQLSSIHERNENVDISTLYDGLIFYKNMMEKL